MTAKSKKGEVLRPETPDPTHYKVDRVVRSNTNWSLVHDTPPRFYRVTQPQLNFDKRSFEYLFLKA